MRYLNTPEDTSGSNSNSSSGGGGTGAGGDGQLTRQRKAVIHYDLKPANILFDEYGDVKITGLFANGGFVAKSPTALYYPLYLYLQCCTLL